MRLLSSCRPLPLLSFLCTLAALPAAAQQPDVGLFVDGGADVVRGRDGRWYVTTTNAMTRGVWLAPLYWNDGLDAVEAPLPPAPRE